MPKEHIDVLICTPGRSMEAAYVRSLLRTVEELDRQKISWRFLNAYSPLVSEARETTASGRGLDIDLNDRGPLGDAVTYKKMFWIDSDIAWEPGDFMRLYQSEHPVIAGVYLLTKNQAAVHAENLNKLLRSGDVVEVDSVGFGFIAIQTGVFEAIDRPWFATDLESRWVAGGKKTRVPIGEDVSWCRKVRNRGYKIHVDTTVRVQHLKIVPLTWDPKASA